MTMPDESRAILQRRWDEAGRRRREKHQKLLDRLHFFDSPRTVQDFAEAQGYSPAKARRVIKRWVQLGWIVPVSAHLTGAPGRPRKACLIGKPPTFQEWGHPTLLRLQPTVTPTVLDAVTLDFFVTPRSVLEYAQWAGVSVPAAHLHVRRCLDARKLYPAGWRRLAQPGPNPRLFCSKRMVGLRGVLLRSGQEKTP